MLNIKRNGNKKSSKIENSRASLLNHTAWVCVMGWGRMGRMGVVGTRQQISIQMGYPFYLAISTPVLSFSLAEYTHQNIWMKSKQSSCLQKPSLPPTLFTSAINTWRRVWTPQTQRIQRDIHAQNTIFAITVFCVLLPSLPFIMLPVHYFQFHKKKKQQPLSLTDNLIPC